LVLFFLLCKKNKITIDIGNDWVYNNVSLQAYKHERRYDVIDLDFRRKSNGVPILSKAEIETLAEMVIKDYNPKLLEEPGILLF
jgi:hypothetical protein